MRGDGPPPLRVPIAAAAERGVSWLAAAAADRRLVLTRFGLLDAAVADLLGRDELEAAMRDGWGPDGPDPVAALVAALERARDRVVPLDADGARGTPVRRGDAARAAAVRATGRASGAAPGAVSAGQDRGGPIGSSS